jgi:hypothetical protein
MDAVGLNGSRPSYSALTPHDLKIGAVTFPKVSFLTCLRPWLFCIESP